MKLHLDKNAFTVLLDNIHNNTGYRTDVLEKDYYVVLLLSELAEKQSSGLKAFFKGGTALYKALKMTNRFSEDIDLSVDTKDCSRTQNEKRLAQAAKQYTSLKRVKEEGHTFRSEVTGVYYYEPVTKYDTSDALQRFGWVIVEATSFTISEPVKSLEISTLLYDFADDSQKQILESNYDVKPFKLKTITIERIFIDKLFAAEAYARKSDDEHRAFEAAKHIYDLAILSNHPDIIKLEQDESMMDYLLKIRIKEEQERLDGIPGVQPKDFIFFTDAGNDEKIRRAYTIMQNQYVMRSEDRINYDVAINDLREIQNRLEKNSAWMNCG